MVNPSALVKITEVEKALASITDITDARKLLALSEGLVTAARREYKAAEQIRDGKDDRDHAYQTTVKAGELRLLAEARLGELIKRDQETGRLATKGRPNKCDTGVTFLKDIGLNRKDSERAQKVAEHQDLIPVVVAKAEESKDLPTRKDLAEEEIAREMGISQGRVSQVITKKLGANIFVKDKCKVREAGKTDVFILGVIVRIGKEINTRTTKAEARGFKPSV